MKRWINVLFLAAMAMLLLPTVASALSVDDDIEAFVGRQNKHYWETQPVHFYDYSAIRDSVIQIQDATIPKMRDTWTVFYDAGIDKPVFWCASKGSPIPGSYQITNPEYIKGGGDANTALPQPEPSGVYTGGDNWQTWVLCVTPDGEVSPIVWEGETFVSYSPIHVDENGVIVKDSGPSSAPIVVH